MTPAALAALKALAEGATEPTGYAGWEPAEVTGEELAELLAKGTGKVWFVWSGTVEDSLYVAITGNGPTSEANARFHSVARASVLALVAEVERLREALEGEYMGYASAPEDTTLACIGCIRQDAKSAQRAATWEAIQHLPGCALRGEP